MSCAFRTIEIAARCKAAPGALEALFDAFAAPSTKLLAFSASECEGEISAMFVAEGPREAQCILETAGFECHTKPAGV